LSVWLLTATLAAAAADTWATSVGALSAKTPRWLAFGQPVAPGTNGGMTVVGSAGAAVGALLVATTGALVTGTLAILPAGTLIGFFGMVVDSIVGAVFQGRFHCSTCDEPSERHIHRCGQATVPKGGFTWLNNDMVNLIATVFAAGAALLIWRWLD
jgi:uncharacterized membrane protein